ncbi:restriction endonuclease subunit S [Candidatus Enterococcus mangumiae]|uniref:Type I restriction enzyme, S subunit n=1 Tax=Candidatus Enterococcus mangumiae TaxID=2230878 RepID=A0ABZ2STJ2_9ENTE
MSKKNVPMLRFEGFSDAWEQRKFESLLDKNDGIRRGPFGSALKKEFFVSKSEYVVYEQQNAIYDSYETRYNISKKKFEELNKFELKPEDFIMSGAGTIGRISRVPNGINKGVFNQALIRFRINKSITDSEYFIQFIRADFMQKKLTGANPGSAITNLVPMAEVKNWIIKFPKIKEQQKIGSFFQQLDDTIALHQRKLEQLKRLKQGFLQVLFANDTTVPKVRFAGFTEEWQQRKFSEVLKVNSGRDYKHLEEGDIPVYGTGGYMLSVNDKLSDIDGIGIGRKGTINKPQYLKAPYWTVDTLFYITAKKGYNLNYLYSMVQRINWKRMDESTGVPSLSKNVIEKVHKEFPSYDEQAKIGFFFKQLDDALALHQKKLSQLKNLKKAFLQKMFI